MKIYLSHSGNYDYESKLYIPLRSSDIAREHQIFFPHDKENINTISKNVIAHSELLIAEVSYPSTGQGIELGWANDGNAQILCIYRAGSKTSSSLRFVATQFIEYDNTDDMLSKLKAWLADTH